MFLIDPSFLNKDMPVVKGGYYLPFHVDHLDNFEGITEYGDKSLSFEDRKHYIHFQSQVGPAVTAFVHGVPVAVFGCVIVWKGLGEAWALFSDEARRYPIAMTKGAKAFFDACIRSYLLHRLQITVKTVDKRAINWAECLGFVVEGTMKEYSSDKQDFYIMRRT